MCVKRLHRRKTSGTGQQGDHSSAANEDSCDSSVKQIETSICVPASKHAHGDPVETWLGLSSFRFFWKPVGSAKEGNISRHSKCASWSRGPTRCSRVGDR